MTMKMAQKLEAAFGKPLTGIVAFNLMRNCCHPSTRLFEPSAAGTKCTPCFA